MSDTKKILDVLMVALPLADKLIFDIGGKLFELNTAEIKSADDVIKIINESKSGSWPGLKFISGGIKNDG